MVLTTTTSAIAAHWYILLTSTTGTTTTATVTIITTINTMDILYLLWMMKADARPQRNNFCCFSPFFKTYAVITKLGNFLRLIWSKFVIIMELGKI